MTLRLMQELLFVVKSYTSREIDGYYWCWSELDSTYEWAVTGGILDNYDDPCIVSLNLLYGGQSWQDRLVPKNWDFSWTSSRNKTGTSESS